MKSCDGMKLNKTELHFTNYYIKAEAKKKPQPKLVAVFWV